MLGPRCEALDLLVGWEATHKKEPGLTFQGVARLVHALRLLLGGFGGWIGHHHSVNLI